VALLLKPVEGSSTEELSYAVTILQAQEQHGQHGVVDALH